MLLLTISTVILICTFDCTDEITQKLLAVAARLRSRYDAPGRPAYAYPTEGHRGRRLRRALDRVHK